MQSFIAGGGMGTVYRATNRLIERDVAVKVLHPELITDDGLFRRFLREAKLASNLNHPSIIKFYDIGEDEGLYYIVMEYVDGSDLRQIIADKGPLSARLSLRVAKQVAKGLQHAHDHGVIHRDIKPANILLASDQSAKIADLGLARPLTDDTLATGSGQVLGTPAYMSPEQCRGDEVDGRSDLYSLGATLYTLLSGEVPFAGKTLSALIHQVVHDRPIPLRSRAPNVPEEVVLLVHRLLAKHPSARLQSGNEVASAIDEIREGGEPLSQSTVVRTVEVSTPRLHRLLILLLVAVVVMVASLVKLSNESAQMTDPEVSAQRVEPRERSVRQAGVAWRSAGEGVPVRRPELPRSPAPRSHVTDSYLDLRVAGFRHAIAQGEIAAIMEYFVPEVRENRTLRITIGTLLRSTRSEGMVLGNYSTRQSSAERATSVILFNRAHAPAMRLPIEWVYANGSWFISPPAQGIVSHPGDG